MGHSTSHEHVLPFWRKYIFSTDHKVIGIQYGITSLIFLLLGFGMILMMRWQLANPGIALPMIGKIFGENNMPGGIMLPEFYNQLGAMHGTIMVFLGVVPLAVGAFGKTIDHYLGLHAAVNTCAQATPKAFCIGRRLARENASECKPRR